MTQSSTAHTTFVDSYPPRCRAACGQDVNNGAKEPAQRVSRLCHSVCGPIRFSRGSFVTMALRFHTSGQTGQTGLWSVWCFKLFSSRIHRMWVLAGAAALKTELRTTVNGKRIAGFLNHMKGTEELAGFYLMTQI